MDHSIISPRHGGCQSTNVHGFCGGDLDKAVADRHYNLQPNDGTRDKTQDDVESQDLKITGTIIFVELLYNEI